MTDFAETPSEPLSTQIDTEAAPAASGGGRTTEVEPFKRESVRDSLDKAAKSVKDEAEPKPEKVEEKPEEKPEAEPKAEEAAQEKPKAADAQESKDEPKPSEGRKHIEAPARLLPKHRELWKSVPHELRAELVRLNEEDAGQITQAKETTERYAEIREYDDLARQNGGSLKQSLERVRQLEDMMSENPIAALNQILLQAGPRKADGQPMSLFELASAITQAGPQGYQQMVQQQPQQPKEDPRIAQYEQQLIQMQHQQIMTNIIEPFKASHPRYDELEPYIASFLKTDIIPQSLSSDQRLAHAYDMADRLYPTQQEDVKAPDADDRGGTSTASKSIKSTPGSFTDTFSDGDRKVSIREAIERAGKKVALRG